MKIVSHKDAPRINVNNLEFQGILEANYNDLVKAYGEPLEGDLYKIDVRWKLRITTDEGEKCSVLLYNFKTGKNYLGEDGLDVEKIPNWHVAVSKNTSINAVGYIEKNLREKLSK